MVWVQKTFFSNSEYISACFVGPECSVVVQQNVRFCLSIHLSVLPAFLEIRWNSLTFCFWLEIFKL